MTHKEIEKFVNEFKTESECGFTAKELYYVLMQVATSEFNLKAYSDAMMGNTCIVEDGEARIFPIDIIKALQCGFEDRKLRAEEFD